MTTDEILEKLESMSAEYHIMRSDYGSSVQINIKQGGVEIRTIESYGDKKSATDALATCYAKFSYACGNGLPALPPPPEKEYTNYEEINKDLPF